MNLDPESHRDDEPALAALLDLLQELRDASNGTKNLNIPEVPPSVRRWRGLLDAATTDLFSNPDHPE